MTAYAFVGYGNGIPPSGGTQYDQRMARAHKRGYCLDREPRWIPPFLNQKADLYWTPVEWPIAVDIWGVAYPADLWALTNSVAVQSVRQATIEADWIKYWTDVITGTNSPTTQQIVAVPKVLPGGYTARLARDWGARGNGVTTEAPTGIIGYTNGFGVTSPSYPIKDANGYIHNQWIPNLRPWGYVGTGVAQDGSSSWDGNFPVGSLYNPLDISTGYRKLQLQVSYLGVLSTGSLKVTISHDAAGTIPATLADGDTIDYQRTFTSADFAGSFVHTTGWIDAGVISPTLGVISYFKSSIYGELPTFTVGPAVVEYRLSPRCDVPLPATATGFGDIIAPGGVV